MWLDGSVVPRALLALESLKLEHLVAEALELRHAACTCWGCCALRQLRRRVVEPALMRDLEVTAVGRR